MVSASDSVNENITCDDAGGISVNDNISQFADGSPMENTNVDDDLINLSECSSLVLHVSDGESVIAFRRDSTDSADLYIITDTWGSLDIVKQYKTVDGYFFHAIVTSNGWVIGTGGVADGSRNRQIENIASEMVLNNEISDSYLRRIYNIISSDELGHFVIKAPDGTYGVVFTDRYHVSNLKPGQYVLCPNLYSYSQKGYYDSSLDVVDAAIKIIYTDSYGINRRNVMTYHYKVIPSSNGLSMGVDVYGSNDNGAGVGRSTAGLADNVNYFGTYVSKSSLPVTPDKVKLGTHIFEKSVINVFKLARPVKTAVIGEEVAVNYQVNYIAGKSPVVKFNIPKSVDLSSVSVSKGTYSYDAQSNVLTWNLNNCDLNNYITLNVVGKEYGNCTISSSLDNANYNVDLDIREYGAVISSSNVTKHYKGPERLNVYLFDTHDNPLVAETVKIKINGVTYNCNVDKDGCASLGLNLPSGEYNATVSYDGRFGKNTTEVNVKILKTVSGDDIVKYYRNATQYAAKFTDTSGNPLVNQVITFNINGVFYDRTTDSNGVARLDINLIPRNYTITALNTVTSEMHSNNIEVLPILVDGHDLTKYYKNDSAYSIKVLDGQGNPVVGEYVKFNINGVFYERQTNASGYAILNINLIPGDYIVTAEYNQYKYSNMVHVLSTISGDDLRKVYRDKNQYRVSLKDFVGNPLANGGVTYNINGVFYNHITDENGEDGLNIELLPGEYIITAYNSLNGEAHSNKVIVYPYSDTVLSSQDYRFEANDDDTIEARLTDRFDKGVSGESITLAVNDKIYTSKTDDNGVAIFYLGLTQGNYTLNFKHDVNSRYGESSAKTKLELYDGPRVSFKGEDDIIISGDNYSVTLYDENGFKFPNQIVYFDFNSNIYNATTDGDGVASVKVNLSTGVYDVRYFYNATGYKFIRGFSKVIVLETGETDLIPLTSFVTERIGENLEVRLLADNIVEIANETVVFEINDINYTGTTDERGIARLPIRLMAGIYDVKYYFEGNDLLGKSNATSKLTVKERIATSFIRLAGDIFHKNAGITYDIMLTSNEGVSNRDVVVKIGSNTYNLKSDAYGIVSVNINGLDVGTYDVYYNFSGDSVYAPCEGSSILTISSQIPYGFSYWVRYNHMYSLDLASLAAQGTKHILLHSYAFDAYGESSVISWIRTANSYGINVHIWMQVFYGGNGWVRPVNDDGSYKYSYFNSKINEAKYYASFKEVAGVHFDYLRFGGTAHYYSTSADAISYFVIQASAEVKSVNPNCLLSAAVMPEPDMMLYYYGQDIPTISKYMDFLVPMVYKGNYGKNTAWIQETTQWFVDNSNGAQIWTGLQTYRSDDDITVLGYNELFNDAQAGLNGGARGITMFRWGLTNYINFNSLIMR